MSGQGLFEELHLLRRRGHNLQGGCWPMYNEYGDVIIIGDLMLVQNSNVEIRPGNPHHGFYYHCHDGNVMLAPEREVRQLLAAGEPSVEEQSWDNVHPGRDAEAPADEPDILSPEAQAAAEGQEHAPGNVLHGRGPAPPHAGGRRRRRRRGRDRGRGRGQSGPQHDYDPDSDYYSDLDSYSNDDHEYDRNAGGRMQRDHRMGRRRGRWDSFGGVGTGSFDAAYDSVELSILFYFK
ncbi:MAG: hypothetical protein M1819_005926 [Sarea resinae]|nr:MAG: hypothetical protein M1819_005926 [Sarea resinae]